MQKQKSLFILSCFFLNFCLIGQLEQEQKGLEDRKEIFNSRAFATENKNEFKKFVIPALISAPGITYGIIALHKNDFQNWNYQIRDEVINRGDDFHTNVDDFLQYLPGLAVVGLNVVGVKGENPLLESSATFILNSILLTGAVQLLKWQTHEKRPDNSAYNSFPSGHTATAFAFAE